MAAPPLAEMRRGQQPIDQPLVGVGTLIGKEHFDFLGRRRQPQQVEAEAAQQRGSVGLGRKHQPVLGELCDHECVDRRVQRVGGARVGNAGPQQGSKGPKLTSLRVDGRPRRQRLDRFVGRRPGSHPAANQLDFLLAQATFPLGRHRAVDYQFDQQAFVRLAGHDRRSALAAPRDRRGTGQVEPRLQLLSAVAPLAVRLQDRSDVGLEPGNVTGRLVGAAPGRLLRAATRPSKPPPDGSSIHLLWGPGTGVRQGVIIARSSGQVERPASVLSES